MTIASSLGLSKSDINKTVSDAEYAESDKDCKELIESDLPPLTSPLSPQATVVRVSLARQHVMNVGLQEVI
jgi:hypothetical protein